MRRLFIPAGLVMRRIRRRWRYRWARYVRMGSGYGELRNCVPDDRMGK